MSHDHGDLSKISELRLWWAVGANVLLTFAQVIGGLISGSLALIADALHNFSDAAALIIALVAIRIGRKPPDQLKTFGYKRAETVAALINLTILILIGLYLVIEAGKRFYNPEPIEGWTVVIIASIALIVDLFTVLITYAPSKRSMNMRVAFLHNVTDALASIGVILAGILILAFDWLWTDAVMTLLISGYVLWQGFKQMPKVIHLLMQGTPRQIDIDEVINTMQKQKGVKSVHHVHIWQLDEYQNALEAHIVIKNNDQTKIDTIKIALKLLLYEKFNIVHSTLETESEEDSCRQNQPWAC